MTLHERADKFCTRWGFADEAMINDLVQEFKEISKEQRATMDRVVGKLNAATEILNDSVNEKIP